MKLFLTLVFYHGRICEKVLAIQVRNISSLCEFHGRRGNGRFWYFGAFCLMSGVWTLSLCENGMRREIADQTNPARTTVERQRRTCRFYNIRYYGAP